MNIDWGRTIAGALAAVASAVVLSTLGAVGTIVGAALGSVIVTVGSAIFAEGIETSKKTLAKAQLSALEKVGVAQAEVQRASRARDAGVRDSNLDEAEQRLAEANREFDEVTAAEDAGTPAVWRQRLRALPWKRITLASLAMFVAAIAVITVVELLAGRSVASMTGGAGSDDRTTIGDVGGGSGRGDRKDQRDDEDGDPQQDPGDQQPGGSPGPSESPAPSDEATAPTESPSPSENATTPTEAPTPLEEDLEEPAESASP